MIASTNVLDKSAESAKIPSQARYAAASNFTIAAKLRDFANLLEQQGADGFREEAYRTAADSIGAMEEPIADILKSKGRESLVALPAIGKSIAGAIAELVVTGRWAQLERLRGDLSPEKLFMTIPGIGPELAKRLAFDAHFETLKDLEAPIHSGTVSAKGLGPGRKQAITAILAERLGGPVSKYTQTQKIVPPIDLILQVDEMYRASAASGNLRKIAPKRFNPSGKQWLPIMHARHDDWHFTALFSNTQLAHGLHKTNDWVVIIYQKEGSPEGRCTVVTETRGLETGKRVIRGRETQSATGT